jgi:hypothetical protein
MLPLWSFPTYTNEDGGEEREDDRVQLLSTSPAHDNMGVGSSELAARGIDKDLQVNQIQEGQHEAGKSKTTRVGGVTRKERHIHVEAARVHWWNGHIEAAEHEFLSALAWYRAPTNFTAQTPSKAAGGNVCNKDMQGDDWPDTATNYVSADGSLRSHANKCGRTCGGDSVEERDAMCAYAAFLFEDTPHKLIAGICRPVFILFFSQPPSLLHKTLTDKRVHAQRERERKRERERGREGEREREREGEGGRERETEREGGRERERERQTDRQTDNRRQETEAEAEAETETERERERERERKRERERDGRRDRGTEEVKQSRVEKKRGGG